jgi:hypothetical protein
MHGDRHTEHGTQRESAGTRGLVHLGNRRPGGLLQLALSRSSPISLVIWLLACHAQATKRLLATASLRPYALGLGDEFVAAHFESTSEHGLGANAYVTHAAASAYAFTTLLPTTRHAVAIARPGDCAALAVTAVKDEWVTFGPTGRDG